MYVDIDVSEMGMAEDHVELQMLMIGCPEVDYLGQDQVSIVNSQRR
jgi:hypothetical protein